MIWLQEKYIALSSSSLPNFAKKGNGLYNFRCIYCGDSKKKKLKSRGYLYIKDNDYHYKCHNCQVTANFDFFLNTVNQSLFKDYKFDCIREKNGGAPMEKSAPKKIEPTQEVLLDKILSRCSTLPRFHPAIKYLDERLIPKETHSEMYYIENIKEIGNISSRYKDRLDKINLKQPDAILFPIYSRLNRLIGMNIRLIHSNPNFRYVTLKISESDDNLVYRLDKASFQKDLFVLEGPFDSLFFDNSIAVIGSSFDKLTRFIKRDNTYFIFDNQNRNKEVVKNYDDYAEMGYKVFVWPEEHSNSKDINDLIKNGFDKDKLEEFIKSNSYQGLNLKLQLTNWKL